MSELPDRISAWFKSKNWTPHPHQQEMVQRSGAPALLLIAPTGGGKTLAGFLPTLAELERTPQDGLHTLYISPLKALAADIKRNLRIPVEEAGLDIRIEDRTGDTSQYHRRRQRADPPHILLTTPESLALLLSYEDAPRIFKGLKRVVVDEVHALCESKRGDQLLLCLSRLQSLCPDMRRVGLSATVDDPETIAALLAPHPDSCDILYADPGPEPDITMLTGKVPPPWSGGGAAWSISQVLDLVHAHKTTLIFHNTRAQCEIYFHRLWLENENGLPIGIHHGSLAREARQKTEAAIVAGELRAIVCTGSLDLGIDWGDVDLVIQIGAPKNVKRLVQRIGRANHQYNAPSKAILVPANRFEVVECIAALDAVKARELDGEPRGPGPLDVLCQHLLIRAASGPFDADALFAEVRTCGPYRNLSQDLFDRCLDYCATGGYALARYDQWQRLVKRPDGLWQLRDPRRAAQIRMNIGTITDTDKLKVRLKGSRGGRPLGEIEEGFAASLTSGDTFLIGGQIVRFRNIRELTVEVTRDQGKRPKVATFMGTKFSTTTQLSARILELFKEKDWSSMPIHTRNWLELQRSISALPDAGTMLVETFPHDGRHHLCAYGFAGKNAQQTLGLLLTRRMEEAGLHPAGFVATDYATLIWGLDKVTDPAALFSSGELRQTFEAWLNETALIKRAFRSVATIAGLIERSRPGARKSGRQTTFSTDILYDTLKKYDPDHLLLDITRQEARQGLIDFGRIEELLLRTGGRIRHLTPGRVTPLAAPMFLEVGRVPVKGAAEERLLAEQAAALLSAAGLS